MARHSYTRNPWEAAERARAEEEDEKDQARFSKWQEAKKRRDLENKRPFGFGRWTSLKDYTDRLNENVWAENYQRRLQGEGPLNVRYANEQPATIYSPNSLTGLQQALREYEGRTKKAGR